MNEPSSPDLIIACVPHDRRRREAIAQLTGAPCQPSRKAVPGECEHCHSKIWMEPGQSKALRSVKARVLCYLCAVGSCKCGAVLVPVG